MTGRKSDDPVQLVLTTCPDDETAAHLARELVSAGLAACVSRLPGLRSVYRWENGVSEDAEVLLLIKTTAARYAALESRVVSLHPYELPELIAVPVDAGLPPYLDWVSDSVRPE
jgi:periplasmic divalent cation tolerance protein